VVKEFLKLVDFIANIAMVATVTIKICSTGFLGVLFSQMHYFVNFMVIVQYYYFTFTY
jgi:hypothetical protein